MRPRHMMAMQLLPAHASVVRGGGAAVGVGGCAATPLRLAAIQDALVGKRLTAALVADAVAAVPGLIDPESSTHASADYRRRAAPQLVQRALLDALSEAAA